MPALRDRPKAMSFGRAIIMKRAMPAGMKKSMKGEMKPVMEMDEKAHMMPAQHKAMMGQAKPGKKARR